MFVKADLMPHRIIIRNIRIERLQDITDRDCIKEGIYQCSSFGSSSYYRFKGWKFKNGNKRCSESPREAFKALIDKVSGKGIWDMNPLVFVYEFDMVC